MGLRADSLLLVFLISLFHSSDGNGLQLSYLVGMCFTVLTQQSSLDSSNTLPELLEDHLSWGCCSETSRWPNKDTSKYLNSTEKKEKIPLVTPSNYSVTGCGWCHGYWIYTHIFLTNFIKCHKCLNNYFPKSGRGAMIPVVPTGGAGAPHDYSDCQYCK